MMVFRMLVLFVISTVCIGCGEKNLSQTTPEGATPAIAQTLSIIQDSTYGGTKFDSVKDLSQFELSYPEAATAIKNGNVVVIWGRKILDNSKDPKIIAYESNPGSDKVWAVKEDGKLHHVTAEEVSKLPKSDKNK